MWKEFKEFAMQGNVTELAIAVIIGAAFSQIVTSLVENIITPLLGILLNGIKFTHLSFTVGHAKITYGIFIQSIVDFFIISFSIFFFIRLIMKFRRKEEEEEEEVDPKEELLTEIRDLLKQQS
ncbi:MAG TPA: large conductance mechanosensitive channel protein MscL [Virgibacillus sp.]|nr:large conductance mechanosensitive channel protein MscL [Virgibacillus sp.]